MYIPLTGKNRLHNLELALETLDLALDHATAALETADDPTNPALSTLVIRLREIREGFENLPTPA